VNPVTPTDVMKPSNLFSVLIFLLSASGLVLEAQDAAAAASAEEGSSGSFFETVVRLNDYDLLSENASEAAEQYIQTRIEYETAMLRNTEEVIRRNNDTTDVVFWIAHCAIVLGMAAALIEFFHSFRLRRRGIRIDNADVTLALESIAIKNASIGTVLLLVSMALYGLFLKFVFPIQELGG